MCYDTSRSGQVSNVDQVGADYDRNGVPYGHTSHPVGSITTSVSNDELAACVAKNDELQTENDELIKTIKDLLEKECWNRVGNTTEGEYDASGGYEYAVTQLVALGHARWVKESQIFELLYPEN